MPNPPVVGWKSYHNEAKNTVDPINLTKIENEFKRVHAQAAGGLLGAKPDDTSENSVFALDEKGPNAQFLTSYSGERAPVRISFEVLEKVLDDADNDGVVAPGAPGTRLTPDEKAALAPPPPAAPLLDRDNKPSMDFESAEGAIQYLRTRYMIQRGFFGGNPPPDAKYNNLNDMLTNLKKASPSEARQLPEAKSLTVAGGANTSIQDVFTTVVANPPAGMPNAGGPLAGDFKTTVDGLITESVITRQFTQNPALADSLLQTMNPDGSLKKIFTLDEKGVTLEEKNVFVTLRQDPALLSQLKQAQREHQVEAKLAAAAPDLSKEIKTLQGHIERQHVALGALAHRTLVGPAALKNMLPDTAYSSHEAKHLMDGFNYAKEQILAKAAGIGPPALAPADLEKVNVILGKQLQQVHINYAKLMQGGAQFTLDDWNNTFKEARRELATLGVPSNALDKLQTDSLKEQIKLDNRSIKEKAHNAYSVLLNDQVKKQQANQNRSFGQRVRALRATYAAELEKQETANLSEFKYLGPDVKVENQDGNRGFATITVNGIEARAGAELRAGTLVNANSPFIVQVSEHKNAQGETEFSFKASYKTEAEAQPAFRNLFQAIKSKAAANEVTVSFTSDPEKIFLEDVISMLKAAQATKVKVNMNINQLMAIKPPTTPQEREQYAEITRLHNQVNLAAAADKKAMEREAKAAMPAPLNAEKIAENQAEKQMVSLQTKALQSLRTLSQEIKLAKDMDVKAIPASLKQAENHIQELKTRLKEAKDEFWRIRQEYKLTESKLPAAPSKEDYGKQVLLKAQLNNLLNLSTKVIYAQERLHQRLDEYKLVAGLDPAAQAQAAQLSKSTQALGNELDKFIHTEMQNSRLTAPPPYGPPLPPYIPAVAPALAVGPNLFNDAVKSAQQDEKKPEAKREFGI